MSKRILLIQLPTSHHGAGERVYPLGLSRLARLIPDTHVVQGLDMNLFPDPWPILKEKMEVFVPDSVALSFRNIDPLASHHISYISSLKTAAVLVRKVVPSCRIIAGGPAFSLFAGRLMEEIPEIDAGIVGEAEAIFPAVVCGGEGTGALPGLIRRRGGRIVVNAPGKAIALELLPDIETELFPPVDYLNGNKYVAAMGIEGKRGCDLTCGYCRYPFLSGGRIRLRPPEKIVTEMEMLHREHGAQWFHFTDAVVNRPSDHFEAVCREICRRKLSVKWTGFFREDAFTPSQAALAARAGLVAIYFSADALTEHGLKVLKKQLTLDHLTGAARVSAQSGILTMHHFLVNLPGEGPTQHEEAKEMLDRILDIHAPAGNLGAVIFNTLRLYPEASLTRELLRNGLLDPSADLLYPTYYNPPKTAHLLHELDAHCHAAGVFSRLSMGSQDPSEQGRKGVRLR
ncbi:MAG: radical SAM protein [Pseudomonadota bacterium]